MLVERTIPIESITPKQLQGEPSRILLKGRNHTGIPKLNPTRERNMADIKMLENEEVELVQYFLDEIERRIRPEVKKDVEEYEKDGRKVWWEFRDQKTKEKTQAVLKKLIDLVLPQQEEDF